MGRRQDYIPLKDDDFFNFQGNLVNKVVPNKTVWAIPDAAVTVLTNRRAEYEPLYHVAQNKTRRNMADVLAHRQSRKLYEKEIRIFVKSYLMFNPLVTDGKRVAMGLTVRDAEPSPSKPITDVPSIGLRGLSGGDIEVVVRASKDQNRASMHPDANVIEYRYSMVKSGDAPPKDPEECPRGDVQTKAKFVLRCGAKNAGKRFYGFFRWLNNKRPRQEGPWTSAQTVVIA